MPAWPVWIIVFRDVFITWLRTYAEYKGRPIDTTKFAKTKTFLQFTVIYYVLLLYIARQTEYFMGQFGPTIESLLDYTLLYTLTVIIAVITLWTGVLYVIDNWKTIRELYDASARVTQSE